MGPRLPHGSSPFGLGLVGGNNVSLVEELQTGCNPLTRRGDLYQGRLAEAVADWCGCLQGQLPLVPALGSLAKGLGAKAVCLSRHPHEPGRAVRALAFTAPLLEREGIRVSRSFARCVMGRYVGRARPGSLWLSSATEEQGDPALQVFQRRARIADSAVVALALGPAWADYLEIHFASTLGAESERLLAALGGTLSRTWLRRTPGLFSEAVLASRPASRPDLHESLLSVANPARLSRAEFRICVLLRRGLNSASLCSELSISPSTLRAHLRSIFAKAQVASMAELVYRLLTPPESLAGPSLAARRA